MSHRSQCALLGEVQQAFEGTQQVGKSEHVKEEAWHVRACLEGCDLERGTLCGSMDALNAPSTHPSVVTFWEGEIVDNRNHFFPTGRWEASDEVDMKHWSSFPGFAPLKGEVERNGGRNLDLRSLPFLFMRWKEQFFVNVTSDCGLTIAGFYYVCFSRADGSISGYYYDPDSSPFQQLELRASCEGRAGHSSPMYSFR